MGHASTRGGSREHKGWVTEHKGWVTEHKGWVTEHKGWVTRAKGVGTRGGSCDLLTVRSVSIAPCRALHQQTRREGGRERTVNTAKWPKSKQNKR